MRIMAAEWVLPISSPPIQNGAIVIENGRVIAVDKKEKLVRAFHSSTLENFGAAAIIPGLINCHSHLELTVMRGLLDDVEEDFLAWLLKLTKVRAEFLTDEDIQLSALLGVAEGARAGVTCFADVGRNGLAAIKALKQVGLRGIVYQETEFSPDGARADDDFQKLKEKYLAIKEYESPLIEAGISPHSPYTVCAELFRKIAEFAVNENIKTSIHTAESDMEEAFMRRGSGLFSGLWKKSGITWQAPGTSSVEYLSSIGVLDAKPLLVHCINVDESDLALIAESGSTIAHCPKSNAKFGHGTAPLEKFLAGNVVVGLGSDSVASNNSCDIIEEARFASLLARTRSDRQRLIPAAEMLEMATLGGARALGLEKITGSLEPGKQADIAVISLANPAQLPVFDAAAAIVFSSNARDVILTMAAGNEIYRGGRVKTLDESSIKQRAAALVQRISA
jgi:5-methylthioadenosine/S-adenosylhomocysteine deaminase